MFDSYDLSVCNFDPDPERLSDQIEVARTIAEHFTNGSQVVVAEAPTGAGKSLLAELVRQTLNTRMLYCATDKSLQRQFVNDFSHSTLLMGRGNYPTRLFPERFPELSAAECDAQEDDCSWCGEQVASCAYNVAKSSLYNPNAKAVVTNTSYLVAESSIPKSSCRAMYNDALLVIDECDQLSKELLSFAEIRITPRRKKSLFLPDIEHVTKPESWVAWCQEAIPIIKAAYKQLPTRTPDIRVLKRRRGLVELGQKLTALLPDLMNGNWILDATKSSESIVFKPIMVNDLGSAVLFNHYRRVLMMSATVISAAELSSSLGFENYQVVSVPAKIPVSNRPVYLSPVAEMTHKNKDQTYPMMVDAVGEIIAAHPGERGLVHAQSFHLAQAIVEGVGMDRVKFYSDAESKREMLEWYVETPDAVLVAASMQRGWDGKDDLVRFQVIPKTPYASLGDKQVSARFHAPQGKVWYSVDAIRTLVQASGRGSRHEEDFAITYILDQTALRLWNQNRNLFPSWYRDAVSIKPWKHLQRELQQRVSQLTEGVR